MKRNEKIDFNFNIRLEINDILYDEILTGRSLYKVYNHENALYYTLKCYDLSKNSLKEIKHEMITLNRQLNLPGLFPKYHYIHIDTKTNEALLLMDWIEGATLDKKFKKPAEDKFDVKTRLNFVKSLCFLVNKIHSNGITHRDLKPQNIITRSTKDPRDSLSIIDFGLSASKPTMEEGSIGFRSPEQEFRTNTVSKQSDIYSIGQVAFWLLTMKPFYAEHEDYQNWYQADFSIEIDGIKNKKLEIFFSKILAFNPKDRFQSARDVIESLSKLIKEL